MQYFRPTITILILCLGGALAGGCQPARSTSSPQTSGKAPAPVRTQSNPSSNIPPAGNQPIAYVASQPITTQTLLTRLIQNNGGETLTEVVLDQMLQRRLAEQGLLISQDQIDAERRLLLEELSPDPDQAVRLMKELQRSRGITQARFRQTLWRNAAMRAIVRPAIQIQPQMLQQAFEMEYGELLEARIITTATLREIQEVQSQLRNGGTFGDLAIRYSTDPSRDRGGLLEPLSHADPSYPAAIRNTLVSLEPGQVSPPVAIENGFAILKLERKIVGENVKFDDVKDTLTSRVQRQQEQIQMRQLARTLLSQAEVVVLDPTLKEGWDRQMEQMRPQP
jgi:foldase protein PrsA